MGWRIEYKYNQLQKFMKLVELKVIVHLKGKYDNKIEIFKYNSFYNVLHGSES
jgi:hypothetical protein